MVASRKIGSTGRRRTTGMASSGTRTSPRADGLSLAVRTWQFCGCQEQMQASHRRKRRKTREDESMLHDSLVHAVSRLLRPAKKVLGAGALGLCLVNAG